MKIRNSEQLFEGDYLAVLEGVLVVRFKDDSTARLAPGSRLLIRGLKSGDGASVITRLRLEVGKVWMNVKRVLEGKSSYEVEAEDVVAAVRGTEFGVEVSGDDAADRRYNLHVYEGRVHLAQERRPQMRPIILGARQVVSTGLRRRVFELRSFDPKRADGWQRWNRGVTREFRQRPGLLRDREGFRLHLDRYRQRHPETWEWMRRHPEAQKRIKEQIRHPRRSEEPRRQMLDVKKRDARHLPVGRPGHHPPPWHRVPDRKATPHRHDLPGREESPHRSAQPPR